MNRIGLIIVDTLDFDRTQIPVTSPTYPMTRVQIPFTLLVNRGDSDSFVIPVGTQTERSELQSVLTN